MVRLCTGSLICVALVTACCGGASSSSTTYSEYHSSYLTKVVKPKPLMKLSIPLLHPSAEGDTALLRGMLVVQRHCLYIVSGDRKTLPAFATFDTKWDDQALDLVVRGRHFKLHRLYSFGGGLVVGPATTLNWVVPPHPSCVLSPVWIVSSIS